MARRSAVTCGAAWLPILALGMVGAVGFGGPARAQLAQGLTRPQVTQDSTPTKKQPAPPALPGSKPPSEAPAPGERAASDMPPNEALFDAVNRGDIAGARDALSRGADVDARNVLGETALDLSIDLGRNDITFVLLSMRTGGGVRPNLARAGSPAGQPERQPTPAAEAAQARLAARAAARAARPVAAASAAPPQRPQLYAGNGGSPVPQAGFLGFNNGSTP